MKSNDMLERIKVLVSESQVYHHYACPNQDVGSRCDNEGSDKLNSQRRDNGGLPESSAMSRCSDAIVERGDYDKFRYVRPLRRPTA